MNAFFKISKQTLWQSVVKLITTSSGFIILSAVARNYGEDGTGTFTLALTYLGFFYILSDFGFNALVVARLQEKDASLEWRKLLGTRILWSTGLIILALTLLLLLPFSTSSFGQPAGLAGFSFDFKLAVILGSLTILFFAVNITSHSLFQARLKYQYDIFPTILGVSLGTAVIILLANFGLPIYTLILGYVVAWLVHSLGTYLFVGRFLKNLSPIFDLKYTKQIFREVLPVAATLVLNVLYFRIDTFILASYYSQATVGVYNMAYQFFQSVLVMPTFIMNSFYPMMLETLKLRAEGFFKQIKLAMIGLLFFSLFLSVLIYFLAPFAIGLVASNGFKESIRSLQILSFGFPAYFLSSLFMWVMVSKKMYIPLVSIYLIGLIFNLAANLIYIPRYSYIAASWITGFSEYLILLLQAVVLWRHR